MRKPPSVLAKPEYSQQIYRWINKKILASISQVITKYYLPVDNVLSDGVREAAGGTDLGGRCGL